MQSKTSLFNTAIIRDDLRRTAPAWAGLTGFWLVTLTLFMVVTHNDYVQNMYAVGGLDMAIARTLCVYISEAAPMVAFCYGPLIAMMIFHTMYTTRGAVGTHALPVTRTQLFFNHWVSALLCAAVPTGLVCLLTAPLLLAWNAGNLNNLAMLFFSMVGSFIWDFSFAAFCAMFTGQIFWMPVFYGIVALLPYAAAAVWDWLGDLMLFGYGSEILSEAFVSYLSPGTYLIFGGISARYEPNNFAAINPGGMAHVAACAAAGLALAVVTWQLYRIRHLETAGEIVTYPVMRVVFRIGVAVCSGMVSVAVLQEMCNLRAGLAIWLATVPGVVIGLIAAQMLVKKSFRVVSKRILLECFGVILALGVVVGVLAIGGLGYEKRVPDPEKVEYISLHSYGYNGPATISGEFRITDPDDILAVTQLHRQCAETCKDQDYWRWAQQNNINYREDMVYGINYSSANFRIVYHMKNGGEMRREYNLYITPEMMEDPTGFAGCYQSFLRGMHIADYLSSVRELVDISAISYLNYDTNEDYEPGYVNLSRDLGSGAAATLSVVDTMIEELEYMGELPVTFFYDEAGQTGEIWHVNLWIDSSANDEGGYIDISFMSELMPRTAYALASAPETVYSKDRGKLYNGAMTSDYLYIS